MIAITRDVSRSIVRAELTHLERTPIDPERASAQHHAYRALLRDLGCDVVEISADEAQPDGVFIEDTAIVLDDVAVITRPGAESRRGEVEAVAKVLEQYRPLERIEPPATLDGGDVLVLDGTIYVGRSSRTNEEGVAQLRQRTGRNVIAVDVHGALHLKTAVTRVATDILLVNPDWVDVARFQGWRTIEVDREEPFAANALLIGRSVIYPAAFARTRARLESHGIDVRTVDADELAKAEGGVTCCCLLVK